MHRHSFSFDFINFPLSLLGLFLLFLSMRIVVVVVLYFAMWSLSLFHMFVFCSCRMSTSLTHSFRVCYLQFALTRDNHPKERKSSKCCRFSLVPAGQFCWFECPTSSSSSKELVRLCVYFIQSGTWQSSRVAFKSRILWILREIYKIEIALRCALSLEACWSSWAWRKVNRRVRKELHRAGRRRKKCFTTKFPSRERPTTTINSNSPVFGLWSINSNS